MSNPKSRRRGASSAIDDLADVVPGGHLMVATSGAALLRAAANIITEAGAEVERLTADLAAARAERDGLAKALRDLRSDLRTESERQGGMFRHFFLRVDAALAALPKEEPNEHRNARRPVPPE